MVGLVYNSKDDSLSTSNGIENHIKKGVQLALEEIKGNKIDIVTEWLDGGETTESTLKITQQLALKNYDFLIGPSHSFQVELLSKFIQEKKLKTKIISPTATSDDLLKYRNTILMSNANSVQAKLIVRETSIKKTQTLLLVDIKDCIYCSNLAKFIRGELNALHIPFREIEIFESDLKNPNKYKINQTFDHIFIPALEAQIADIISVLWENNKSSYFWSCDGVGTLGRFITQLPFSDKLKISWLSHYHHGILNKNNKEFLKTYRKRFNLDPIDTSAFYYESLLFTVTQLINKKIYNGFLTGDTTFSENRLVRKMPLLTLSNGQVQFKKLVQF